MWRRHFACRVDNRVDGSAKRPHECGRGRHECPRHIAKARLTTSLLSAIVLKY